MKFTRQRFVPFCYGLSKCQDRRLKFLDTELEIGVRESESQGWWQEPSLYNDFLRRLKKTILQNELARDRRELWWLIRRSDVGLIEKSMSELSNVTEQEAREVGSP